MTFLTDQLEANRKFAEAHGGEPLYDPDTGQHVYPDGTTRRYSDITNLYEIYEPMTPDAELRGKRRYVALLLHLEQHDFTNFKNECKQQANTNNFYFNMQPPPPNAAELLKAGAKRIAKLQKNLDQLDREIAQLPDEVAKREYLEEQRQRALANREQAIQIQSINY